MAWKNITENAARTHVRLFGVDANLLFSDGRQLHTKAILSPHMTHLKEYHSDYESFALIASLSKEDIEDPQAVSGISIQEKNYQIIKYKIEPDGFYVFFLSE